MNGKTYAWLAAVVLVVAACGAPSEHAATQDETQTQEEGQLDGRIRLADPLTPRIDIGSPREDAIMRVASNYLGPINAAFVEGGALVEGIAVDPSVSESEALRFVVTSYLFGSEVVPVGSELVHHPGLLIVKDAADVYLIDKDDAVVAVVDSDGNVVTAGVRHSDGSYLEMGNAAGSAGLGATIAYLRARPGEIHGLQLCLERLSPTQYANDTELLIAFAEAAPARDAKVRDAEEIARLIDEAADLADSLPESTDEATDRGVVADHNDIYRQLAAGTKASDVAPRKTVPVAISHDDTAAPGTLLVFIDSSNGELLGFVGAGGKKTNIADIAAPARGAAVDVYLADSADLTGCVAPDVFANAVMQVGDLLTAIPYDTFAGSGRATVSVADESWSALDADG